MRDGVPSAIGGYLFRLYDKLIVFNERGLRRILRRAAHDAQNEGRFRGDLVYILVYIPDDWVDFLFFYVKDWSAFLCKDDHVRFRGERAHLRTY